MKKFWVLAIGLCVGYGGVRAQAISVMAEQLAELQDLQHTIRQGYRIMASGLDTIGVITNGELQLHQVYFASLETVKPILGEDPRVMALRDLQEVLVQRLKAAIDYWRRQQDLTTKNN